MSKPMELECLLLFWVGPLNSLVEVGEWARSRGYRTRTTGSGIHVRCPEVPLKVLISNGRSWMYSPKSWVSYMPGTRIVALGKVGPDGFDRFVQEVRGRAVGSGFKDRLFSVGAMAEHLRKKRDDLLGFMRERGLYEWVVHRASGYRRKLHYVYFPPYPFEEDLLSYSYYLARSGYTPLRWCLPWAEQLYHLYPGEYPVVERFFVCEHAYRVMKVLAEMGVATVSLRTASHLSGVYVRRCAEYRTVRWLQKQLERCGIRRSHSAAE